jgi:PAS domain S-box-containing protein
LSKAEQPSDLFDDKCKILFNYLPMPSYAWQIINEDDFILINYNQAAHEITKGTIEEFVGTKASDFYKDQPEILDDLQQCSKEKSNFFKEMKYNFKSGIEKYLSVNYGFIPPDIIVVLTKDITEKRKAEIKNAEIELELKKSEKELKKLNLELEQTIEERTKELKKSEQRYRLIAENVNDMIAILNEDQIYEYINEGIHNQQRGTSNEQLIGTSPLDIVHPDEVEMNRKSFRKTLREGEGVLETRIRNIWGGYNWFEVKGKTFIDVDGKKKVLIIARDINDRKEKELLLKQSEQKYRHLFEKSPYRIVLINTDGKIIDYNSSTSNLMSNNKIDLIGKDFRELEFITQDNLQILKKMFTDLLIKGFTNAVEVDFGKESNLGWANLHASIVQIDNQKIIQVLVEDINERKKAELKLKGSEQKYRLITENLNDLIGIINAQFKIEYFNEKGLKELSGFSTKERVGKSPLELIHPDDYEKAKKSFSDAFKTGEGMEEIRFKVKNGAYLWLEVKGKTFIDIDKKKKLLIVSRDITERKIAEEKLKESEEIFRSITEQSLLGIAIMQDNLIKYVNNRLAELFGIPVEEVIEWKASEFLNVIHPDDRLFVAEQARKKQSGENGVISRYKFRGIKKNSDIIWLELFSKTINYQGKPADLVTMIDITESKSAELKLIESEENYRELYEEAPNAYFSIGSDKKLIRWNKAAESLLGYTKEDFLCMEVLDLYADTENGLTKALKTFQKFLQGYEIRDEILQMKHKNGNIIWVSLTVMPLMDLDGNVIESRSMIIDITERKKAEEEISNLAKFPAENPNPVLRVNKEEIIYNNQTGQKFFNIKVGAKIPFELYDIVQTAFKENTNKTLEIVRANKVSSFVITPIQGTGYANIYGIDITERKEAEQKIKGSEKKYKDAFNRANFYKDLFVHDINNIMQVINSSAELISYQSDQLEQTIDIDMITNMIKKQVMRAKKLVQSVNTLSELENNEKPIRPTEVCVLLKNTFNYINTAYQERNVNIQFEYFSKRIYAMANDVLQDVFDNILINSVKYTNENSPEIFIKITKEKRDKIKYVKIEFIDNGIGIADDRKEIIFKRGHRELKGQKGMGLGLSLVKKIVKNYNGKIWVEDRVKDDHTQGSNFILLIPQST